MSSKPITQAEMMNALKIAIRALKRIEQLETESGKIAHDTMNELRRMAAGKKPSRHTQPRRKPGRQLEAKLWGLCSLAGWLW
jgi:hypothetical protein